MASMSLTLILRNNRPNKKIILTYTIVIQRNIMKPVKGQNKFRILFTGILENQNIAKHKRRQF